MKSGRYDGSNRDDYFQGVDPGGVTLSKRHLFLRAEEMPLLLPLLPPAPMPRRAAAGAGGRAELRAGLPRVGGLE